jgi:hypothetical protein
VTEQDETMKMAGDACELVNQALAVFIHYRSATAHEFALPKWRSTLGCSELLEALNNIGMSSLADNAEDFLNRFSFYSIHL